MSDMRKKQQSGFTIVELLIVIVVIGILAAITIVAYNGIQARAYKTNQIAAVKAYRTALELYYTQNQSYPSTSTYCLGSDYTDHTGDSTPDCRWGSGNVNPNATFNTQLAEFMQGSPKAGKYIVKNGSASVAGLYFMQDDDGMLDGVPQNYWLVYGTADKVCPIGPTPQLTDTYPIFTSKSDTTPTEPWVPVDSAGFHYSNNEHCSSPT